MRPLVNPHGAAYFAFLCGMDYLRVTFTPDLPLRWICVKAFRGIVFEVAYVSHAFLTTFLIGIEALV